MQADEKLVGSSICYTNCSSDDTCFDIFVTSHFQDATLFRLKTITDPERIAQLSEAQDEQSAAEKRQRLNSGDHLPRRRRQLTFYEPLTTLDSLPIVSPVADAIQIPSIAGVESKSPHETTYGMDFLVGSGNQVKSYLTFAAASVPLIDS